MKRVTLTDVAKAAGVSVQTASHVMAENLTVRLPDSTRERVKAAALSLGYQPNRLARAMKTGRTHVLSLWMPVDRPNPAYMSVLKYVSKYASEAGYELNIVGLASGVAYGAERTMPTQWPVDGIVVFDAGRAVRVFREDPFNQRVPMAIMGLEEFEGVDTVGWDLAGGARSIAESLIAEGRTRIAHLAPAWVLKDYPHEQRRKGYSAALAEAGLEEILLAADGEAPLDGERAVLEYVRRNPAPDAIIGFLDPLALGALRALEQRGVKVPKDCSVWGYGNFPEGEQAKIPLSSHAAPLEDLCRQAIAWVVERIEQPSLAARLLMLETTVFERESTLAGESGQAKISEARF